MRLNTTYLLSEVLDALTKASDNIYDKVEEMKRAGTDRINFTTYDGEGLLSTSPYARVTLTKSNGKDRWEGYMETSFCKDGPRVPIAVARHDHILIADGVSGRIQIAPRVQ